MQTDAAKVRWSACSEETLEHHKGFLGFDYITEGHFALNIVETLERTITRLCTVCSGGPGPQWLDEDLKAHIFDKVEVWCADAASNEFAAGRLARKGAFRNIMHVSKDNTHASVRSDGVKTRFEKENNMCPKTKMLCLHAKGCDSTVVFFVKNRCRVIKRPWAADDVLNQIMERVISSSSSIVQRIEHSDTFSNVFAKFCSKQESSVDGSRIRNLRSQKNRFASYSKPLGRTTLFMDSVIRTAQWISVQRRGEDVAHDALAFLDFLNEEVCLLLSMMAEASDEATRLIRYFDTEAYDAANIHEEICVFVNRLKHLFLDGAVMDSGYTREMLTYLQVQRAFMNSRGAPKTLGGLGRVTEDLKRRCLNRMSLYVNLAIETLRSEFPDFDIIMCFSVFKLDQQQFGRSSVKREERLERLAQVFGLDLQQLTDQFFDLRPMALHEYAKGCASAQAWVVTIQRLETKQAAVRRHHPTSEIRSVVMRCLDPPGFCF
jgi:hypothetical protein